jgi:hypothetical protein
MKSFFRRLVGEGDNRLPSRGTAVNLAVDVSTVSGALDVQAEEASK